MRYLAIAAVLLSAMSAFGQNGPCTEQSIRRMAQQSSPPTTDDAYFFSGAFDKPIIGNTAREKQSTAVGAERKNEQYGPNKPELIVVAQSGDMAYEYGTSAISYDERGTGKHLAFTAAYLRMWKTADGRCKVAASMYQAMKQEAKK